MEQQKSLKHFIATHPKQQGRSRSEQAAAHTEWLRQKGDLPQKHVAREKGRKVALTQAVLARRTAPLTTEHLLGRQLQGNDYLISMMDPFTNPPARFPDMPTNVTSTFAVTQLITINADTNGNAAFFLKPGVSGVYAASSEHSDLGVLWATDASGATILPQTDMPGLVWNLGDQIYASLAGEEYPGQTWTLRSYAVLKLSDLKKTAEIRGLFASTRVTAAGVSFRYVGKPLEAEGRIAVAPWKGEYGAPTVANTNLNISDRSSAAPSEGTGPNYENVSALDRAITGSTLDGITAHWSPTGIEAAAEFRPTKYTPIAPNANAVQAINGSATSFPVLDPPDFGACNCETTYYKRAIDNVLGQEPFSGIVTGALPATVPAYSYDAHNFTRSWAGTTTGVSASETAANYGNAVTRRLEVQLETAMATGDNGIIFAATGLDPSIGVASATSGRSYIQTIKPAFEVTMVIHFEGIVDQRTLTLGRSLTDVRSSIQSSAKANQAIAAASLLPPAHIGPASESAKNAAGWMKTAGSILSKSVSAAIDIAPKVAAAIDTGGGVLDILGEIAAGVLAFL